MPGTKSAQQSQQQEPIPAKKDDAELSAIGIGVGDETPHLGSLQEKSHSLTDH